MKYRIFLSAFFLATLWMMPAQAEYRVFLLKISKKSEDPNMATDFRQVESTLDPDQYRYYYPVAADEIVTYTDTWRCYGRTDQFKPHCPNPKAQIAPEEKPET